ncbi:hypothetical protein P3S67_025981 [Capsicum chacoense]
MNKVLQNGESFHFKVTKKKSITAAKLISLMKEFFRGFGYMRSFLIWKDCAPVPYPTVREMEQRYMKTFKTYTDEVKDMSIDALKAQLKGVTVLTSSTKGADENKDLNGHHYVPSPPRACDHAGSSGLKTSPYASNDDDLRDCIALLKKSLLDIASFVRDERLRRIEKNKKKQQKEAPLLAGIK